MISRRENLLRVFRRDAPAWIPIVGHVDPYNQPSRVGMDPALNEGVGVGDEAARLLDGTGLEVRAVKDGVVELTGSVASQDDLRESVDEVTGLVEVRDVDTTDVDVG